MDMFFCIISLGLKSKCQLYDILVCRTFVVKHFKKPEQTFEQYSNT